MIKLCYEPENVIWSNNKGYNIIFVPISCCDDRSRVLINCYYRKKGFFKTTYYRVIQYESFINDNGRNDFRLNDYYKTVQIPDFYQNLTIDDQKKIKAFANYISQFCHPSNNPYFAEDLIMKKTQELVFNILNNKSY